KGSQSSFWQFSDNLRLQTGNNVPLNDSIWSANYAISKRSAEERRNFDFRNAAGEATEVFDGSESDRSDFNNIVFGNDIWKAPVDDAISLAVNYSGSGSAGLNLNGGFNKGVFSGGSSSFNFFNGYTKARGFVKNIAVNKGRDEDDPAVQSGKKKNKENGAANVENNKSAADKRFKTLPPAEALPRNETIGGYIFVCNNDTMAENLKRQLFGLPPRYRDSVRAITPGLPLFLYNYSTHQLHGIFEAAGFGGTNIDPSAWEDKKNPGESRFPAQVPVVTRKICDPLEEDSFRPILHHYDGPKFRLELNIPEALSLLDIFADNN
ncbi:hypothetical protein M569_07785, partial [Genlisea aurea]